jgi:hypothetical protein
MYWKVFIVLAAAFIATVASNASYPKPAYPSAPAYPSYSKSYDYRRLRKYILVLFHY